MKITLLIMLLSFTTCFSQSNKFEFNGRATPSLKREALIQASSVIEIMPEFCKYFRLSFNEFQISRQLKSAFNSEGYYIEPQGNIFQIMEFVSVDIFAWVDGKGVSAESKGDLLTAEQKNILYAADLGTDINIWIKFKNKFNPNEVSAKSIYKGQYAVAVVPEIEAEFPGGNKELSEYLNQKIFNQITEKSTAAKIQQVTVRFAVNEEGRVTDAIIFQSSTMQKIDKVILEAINAMPRWKPAKNLLGINVKQEFVIPFGDGC